MGSEWPDESDLITVRDMLAVQGQLTHSDLSLSLVQRQGRVINLDTLSHAVNSLFHFICNYAEKNKQGLFAVC